MPRLRDDALVLRESDWSETSQVVTLFSREHGKVRGLAKGSKRQSPGSVARFSGGIEPLTRGQIVGTLKPVTGLATLTEWDLQDPYPHLRRDWDALNLALYAVDAAAAILPDHEPHPRSFHALAQCLGALETRPLRQPALLTYQWILLHECGFQPQLHQDPRTGLELTRSATYLFDPHSGGLTADDRPAPRPGDENGAGPWRVRGETVDLLRALAGDLALGAGDPLEVILQTHTGVSPDAFHRANRLLCVYLRHLLERELPTMGYLLDTGSTP